jgi:hypothetical protein
MTYKESQTPHDKCFVAGEYSRNFMKTSDVANVADGNGENGREVFEI